MRQEQEAPIERWPAKLRAALKIRVVKGETGRVWKSTAVWADGCGGGGLARSVSPHFGKWLQRLPKDEEAIKKERIKMLK